MSRCVDDLHTDWQATRHREAEAHERVAREARATLERDWNKERLPLIHAIRTHGSAAAMKRFIDFLCKLHDITWIENPRADARATASANVRRRRITIAPVVDEDTFVTALHEAGHCVAERCDGRGLHFVDPQISTYSACIFCELTAWRQAQEWFPFTPMMVAAMQRAFGSHRRSASTRPETNIAADAFVDPQRLDARRQAEARFLAAYERQARVRREWEHHDYPRLLEEDDAASIRFNHRMRQRMGGTR